MKIVFNVNINPKGINEIEKHIEELNLRTEIARTIEKLGYKDYELTIVPDGKRVVLD